VTYYRSPAIANLGAWCALLVLAIPRMNGLGAFDCLDAGGRWMKGGTVATFARLSIWG